MAFGQIDPLNFIVAHRLATNQNIDATTATRHALVGTLLGEGIIGPIIARQLAIRDAAAAPPPEPEQEQEPNEDRVIKPNKPKLTENK